MPTKKPTSSRQVRGNSKYYAGLGRKSVESRIRRHIEAEIVRDPELNTTIPGRKRESDAGYDLSTPKKFAIAPGEALEVGTGVAVKCPKGYFFELRGRSSLNRLGLVVIDDVIDATYTGEIKVGIVHRGPHPVRFKAGDRIAQIIFLPQIHVEFKQVESFDVREGDRGEAGFGSSGQ